MRVLGQKLAKRLCETGVLNQQKITGITLADIQEPVEIKTDIPVDRVVADISNAADVSTLFANKPDVIYHLAAAYGSTSEQKTPPAQYCTPSVRP